MALASQIPVAYHLGNGVTTTFPYAFTIPGTIDSPQFEVYLVDLATGVRTSLLPVTDYSITGLGTAAGGVVTYLYNDNPLPAGFRLVIARTAPYSQTSDVYNSGTLYLQAIEDQLDKTVMQTQQLAERVSRTMDVEVGYNVNLRVVPDPSGLLGWSSDGTALTTYPDLGGTLEDAVAAQLAAEAAADAAELALEQFRDEASSMLAIKLQTVGIAAQLDYDLLSAVPAVNGHLYVDVQVGGVPQPKDGVAYTIINAGATIRFHTDLLPNIEGMALYVEGAAVYGFAVNNFASDIPNDSGVPGANVAVALDNLDAQSDALDARLTTAESDITSLENHLIMKTLFDYGGIGDGVTNNNAAMTSMATALGFICIPFGTFSLSSMTISVPIHFLVGGSLTCAAGQEIIFRNRVTSCKQQIFKGDGAYRSDIFGETGEDSKVVHASWFGVFTVGATISSAILTAKWNKALQWFTYETREGVFELDTGSYYIDGTVTVPRGVHLKGQGTRRTIIDVKGGGFTCFEAGGDAVKITGIMQEQHSDELGQFTGTFIDLLDYNGCEIDDVWVWGIDNGIVFGGNDCQIRHVMGRYNYGSAPAVNSSVVWQKSGQNARIEDIGVRGQTYATTYIIRLGNGNAADILGTTIKDIYCGEESIPVRISASGTQDFNGITIDNIKIFNTDANVAAAVDIQNSGSATVKHVIASNIHGLSGCTNLLRIGQTGTGTTEMISLVSGDVENNASQVAALTRTNGTLQYVVIGQPVNGAVCTIGVTQSGTMSGIVKPAHIS